MKPLGNVANPFLNIVKDKALCNFFNYYFVPGNTPSGDTTPYWDKLIQLMSAYNPASSKETEDIEYLIKYLLMDFVGCTVPLFVEFSFSIIDSPEHPGIKQFGNIEIIINEKSIKMKNSIVDEKQGKLSPEEVQTGW